MLGFNYILLFILAHPINNVFRITTEFAIQTNSLLHPLEHLDQYL